MIIVKIGGGGDINIEGIVADLAALTEKFIIVHGANALRDRLAEDLGRPKRVITSVKGYASVYSDEKLIDVMMMAYAGLRNKRIVERCHQHGINAVGLSGIDGKLIQGKRNSGIRVMQDGKKKIVRDYSGKPVTVNEGFLRMLLKADYVPVLTVPIIDEHNVAINTENDDVVRVLQKFVRANTIVQLIEAPGFLEVKNDEGSVIRRISPAELLAREQQVDGRMRRKMLSLRKLFEHGATKVIIGDGRSRHPVADALAGKGTIIV
ncbi:MAG: [LysW]-aminoadipate kinase [Desulfatiglandaceae bacterium]|jgi:acetylglutamate/LysW-gamma-L-alpha-aminoadipate kinase